MLFVLSNTKVVNSRYFKRQNVVWRRRQSLDGVVFTTRESFDTEGLIVKKKSTPVNKAPEEPFQAGKLFISIWRACDHLDAPEDTAWHLTQTVTEKMIAALSKDLVSSTETLAEMVIETLKAYDTTAYVKYASYHPELVSARQLTHALN